MLAQGEASIQDSGQGYTEIFTSSWETPFSRMVVEIKKKSMQFERLMTSQITSIDLCPIFYRTVTYNLKDSKIITNQVLTS